MNIPKELIEQWLDEWHESDGDDFKMHIAQRGAEWALSQPVSMVPILTVKKEPDYTSRGHFYEGTKPHISAWDVGQTDLKVGDKLYTATQMREYRNQALEDAAKVCDELHWPWHIGDDSGPKECAENIRALKAAEVKP